MAGITHKPPSAVQTVQAGGRSYIFLTEKELNAALMNFQSGDGIALAPHVEIKFTLHKRKATYCARAYLIADNARIRLGSFRSDYLDAVLVRTAQSDADLITYENLVHHAANALFFAYEKNKKDRLLTEFHDENSRALPCCTPDRLQDIADLLGVKLPHKIEPPYVKPTPHGETQADLPLSFNKEDLQRIEVQKQINRALELRERFNGVVENIAAEELELHKIEAEYEKITGMKLR
jgi:hypothetical protein